MLCRDILPVTTISMTVKAKTGISCCGTNPITCARFLGVYDEIRDSSIRMFPDNGVNNPPMHLRSVDFPEPFGPMRYRSLPEGICIDTSDNAGLILFGYRKLRFFISICMNTCPCDGFGGRRTNAGTPRSAVRIPTGISVGGCSSCNGIHEKKITSP